MPDGLFMPLFFSSQKQRLHSSKILKLEGDSFSLLVLDIFMKRDFPYPLDWKSLLESNSHMTHIKAIVKL